ncbi:Hypothetical protein NTJ_15369 [Nesidiocoris tenuis]|uniref:Uncharacterized protein n=1 Tax=Nesidiocoris tenuis TaxID=355587 RepID=A0ABN7BDV0_9HEMI|nr:Hypothetical protein NTJ_15369 [Nesidiocoris tenuis]
MSSEDKIPLEEEQLRYKDEYKRILADLVVSRNRTEDEVAIEGSTSKCQIEETVDEGVPEKLEVATSSAKD